MQKYIVHKGNTTLIINSNLVSQYLSHGWIVEPEGYAGLYTPGYTGHRIILPNSGEGDVYQNPLPTQINASSTTDNILMYVGLGILLFVLMDGIE